MTERVLTRRDILLAFLITLSVAAVYAAIILTLDNTNVGTTNGLWKSPMVHGWETGARHEVDSGGWFYGPLYGYLARLIPDRAVAEGSQGAVITVRKMALLNALAGGIACGAVFLLALRFTPSPPRALLVALAHASSAFIILNSVNSEDVMPAYACFTLTVFFLFEYLRVGRVALLFASAVCCLGVTLLHWTLMIPCVAAVCVTGIWVSWREARPWWITPLYLAAFLGLASLVAMKQPIGGVRNLLYPGKASGASGFLGFGWTKLIYMVMGIGNYFCGGVNSGDYHDAFRYPPQLRWMTVSWIFAAVTLGGLIAALTLPSFKRLRPLAVFGATLVCLGEFEHLYSQPQDPQSQIEPMFASVMGLIVLLNWPERAGEVQASGGRIRALAGVALAGLFVANGIYTVGLMYQARGSDSASERDVLTLGKMFPPATTLVVTHGMEGWDTWVYLETFGGDMHRYQTETVPLAEAFTDHPGISGDAAADLTIRRLTAGMAQGQRVVSCVLWTGTRDKFAYSLTTLVDIETARRFTDRMLQSFHAGKQWETPFGPFVELEPVPRTQGDHAE